MKFPSDMTRMIQRRCLGRLYFSEYPLHVNCNMHLLDKIPASPSLASKYHIVPSLSDSVRYSLAKMPRSALRIAS